MKEIKAYIQRWRTNQVVQALEEAGAPGITIMEIHPVRYGYEPNYFDLAYDAEDIVKRYRNLSSRCTRRPPSRGAAPSS